MMRRKQRETAANTTDAKMPSAKPMRLLYSRLAALGASKPYVKETILPSWWHDEAAAEPSGLLELQMIVSRNLGVDLDVLRSTGRDVTLSPNVPCKFKKTARTTLRELVLARSLATQVARFAALGVHTRPPHIAKTSPR